MQGDLYKNICCITICKNTKLQGLKCPLIREWVEWGIEYYIAVNVNEPELSVLTHIQTQMLKFFFIKARKKKLKRVISSIKSLKPFKTVLYYSVYKYTHR